MNRHCVSIASFIFLTASAQGAEPAGVVNDRTPAGAVGMADRSPDLDVLPGFKSPPPGYGVVPFFWWLGDPLTKERLGWQLEQMEGMGVSGYQINYAHSERGGRSYGLTYPSDPEIFSDEWWNLVGWFMREAGKQGAAVSLSDYTLGFGQGYMVDDLLREHPEVRGMVLRMDKDGKVAPETVPWSLNPMHPMAGRWYSERFFGQFEKRFPGEAGKGLNFFFSDELQFGVRGRLWSEGFASEFRKRKGYDLTPELPALFKDTGPRTPKIRLDYYDVLASLSEEGFFKPAFDWHQERGMILGCDHGGRGRQVDEFGDYFRTQRWNQGPGSDQPRLARDLIKAKVAASIAHLYQRPRVWLEGFYGSGWGTSSAGFIDATFANYALGYNLLGIHGMYYSTHGGWWEWAPPDNTFRMPYWRHMKGFMDCQQRLAYLLSQGDHRCDVAVLYPTDPVHAGIDGKQAVDCAFRCAETLHAKSIDFDFMDSQSLERARIVGREIHIGGNIYKALILPGMKAIRHATLGKALEFKRAGGCVLAIGALPEASDRVGRNDPEVKTFVRELFPGGIANDPIGGIPFRDYTGPGIVNHRRIGFRDVYAIYGAPKGTECTFRANGAVELWDPWTGGVRSLPVIGQSAEGTKLKLPLTEKELQLIVFAPGTPSVSSDGTTVDSDLSIPLDGEWDFELKPVLDNRFGDFHWPPSASLVGAEARRMRYADEVAGNPGWEKPGFDDSKWREVTCGYGPSFWLLGPLPASAEIDAELASIRRVDPNMPVVVNGSEYLWQPYDYSWRYGIPGDCGRQGYHGLKIRVMDENIGLGAVQHGHPECKRVAEKNGTRYYLWTSVDAPRAGPTVVNSGGLLPAKTWLRGRELAPKTTNADLERGSNPLLLRYDQPGRGWLVFGSSRRPVSPATDRPLPWNTDLETILRSDRDRLPFDTRPEVRVPAGWYRFTAPPGLRGMCLPCQAKPRVWVDGKGCAVGGTPGAWSVVVAEVELAAPVVAIRLQQTRGEYGGAAFSDYIRLECGNGRIKTGDWSRLGVLETYSGGAWYRKIINLPEVKHNQTVVLDLGNLVSSAEVHVNGRSVGVRTAPPWCYDLTGSVRAGENRIEVLVCNTLANHYVTVPTHYRGSTESGLIGPVEITISR
ncbi:MAG: hypothetical protein J0M04_16175 [Verrucomicrobia bacterium]|nr:hypothetical protein [Verrucomicrobiota bacterium]